jgi:hypothetical protein
MHNRLMRRETVDEILADRAAAARNRRAPPRREILARARRRRRKNFATLAALALILLLGLYMRLDNLRNVQHFSGDPGRDYLAVMEWAENGRWPLLGPARNTEDFTIGPGWFYTIAPAIVLSGYSVAAGAATVGVLGIASILLAFFWVRRGSGSAAAALATAAFFAFGGEWVEAQRTCWSPHVLPLGTVAATLLIRRARRCPLSSAALYSMLVAILPQWHTTGWAVAAISLPFFAFSFWRGRRRVRRAPRRARIVWIAATALVLALLYVPPMIHEFTAPEGNLLKYAQRTWPGGAQKADRNVIDRLLDGGNRLSQHAARRNFAWSPLRRGEHGHVGASLALMATTTAGLLWRCAGRRRRPGAPPARLSTNAPSVWFLLSLALAYWLLASALGDDYFDYYGAAFFPVPILLTGWAAGALLRQPGAASGWLRPLRIPAAAVGVLAIGGLCWSALDQLPGALAVHNGGAWHGEYCRDTRRVADEILKRAGDRPFGFKLVESRGGDIGGHYHALLWRGGNRPANHREWGDTVDRNAMGRVLFLLVGGPAARLPLVTQGLNGPLDPPEQIEAMLFYRIRPTDVPPRARALRFSVDKDALRMTAEF